MKSLPIYEHDDASISYVLKLAAFEAKLGCANPYLQTQIPNERSIVSPKLLDMLDKLSFILIGFG
jgi:hypothetical protein